MIEKVPNILCGATAALEFIHVGGTLAKHAKAGGKAVAVVAWDYPENVKGQIGEAAKLLGLTSESSALSGGKWQPIWRLRRRL